MDHSKFRFLTNGLDTSSGLALLFRDGELISRASLPPPVATDVRAMITLALGGTHQFVGTARLGISSVDLTPEGSYNSRDFLISPG